MRRWIVLAAFVTLTIALWILDYTFDEPLLQKAFITAASFAFIYFIFRLVIEERAAKGIRNPKVSYSLRKLFSILYFLVLVSVLALIWIPDPTTLVVALGLIGAGVAIALQDIFKNFVGSAVIFFTGLFTVGDRIEVSGRHGDVVDIGLQYTTLMEIGEWVDGDQATGRLTSIPNGQVLGGVVNNYTRDYKFIWDEIELPVTYNSDWGLAIEKVLAIAKRETASETKGAEMDMERLSKKYFFEKRIASPVIYLRFTDNWIDLRLRYVIDARNRRITRSRISTMILEEIQRSGKIKIASQTTAIVEFPEVTVKQARP